MASRPQVAAPAGVFDPGPYHQALSTPGAVREMLARRVQTQILMIEVDAQLEKEKCMEAPTSP